MNDITGEIIPGSQILQVKNGNEIYIQKLINLQI
jgi:hypothetical protein